MEESMYTSAEELKEVLGLGYGEVRDMERVTRRYPMKIPAYYLNLIDPTDPEDPIRKMAVPSVEELDGDGSLDTSGEAQNTVVPGLQHKYRQTAVILSTNDCAMYCRHCFRRRLVGLSDAEVAGRIDATAAYVREHEEITNVLISGGDPLMLGNRQIFAYLEALTAIGHLDYIRFGTRVPVTFPQRITGDPELLEGLGRFNRQKQLVIVTQFNHPREVTPEAGKAVRLLRRLGLRVCNQTVLMRGINDKAEVLGELLRKLTAIGCQPYYVFQCRPVTGVKNRFQVPLLRGLEIVEKAKAMQSGMGKAFKFCLSHPAGKLEILGALPGGGILFKYHEAKNAANCGRIFVRDLPEDACWLPDDPERTAVAARLRGGFPLPRAHPRTYHSLRDAIRVENRREKCD
jgi:lysine 2,3-aminomutase